MKKFGNKFWWLKQLCTPLRYLKIRQGNSKNYKRVFDLNIPVTLAVLTTILFTISSSFHIVLSEGGIFETLSGFFRLLAAFFIAALAAASTFANKEVDKKMRGYEHNPVTIPVWPNDAQKIVQMDITRRQFLCHLFGYLAFLTIIFLLSMNLAAYLVEHVILDLDSKAILIINIILSFIFSSIFYSILITTFVGLAFMTDRIHGPD